jgi:hypothetical protein
MHHPEGQLRSGRRGGGEVRVAGAQRLAHEQQDVLDVPGLHRRVLPEAGPQHVDHGEVAVFEEGGPVLRPLLVDVPGAPLPREGGGEEDGGREVRQVLDEWPCLRRRQVLGDLEAERQVEAPPQVDELDREIRGHERPLRDLEARLCPRSVHPDDVAHAEALEHREPAAVPAPQVHGGRRAEQLDDHGQHPLGGGLRATADALVEGPVVR